MNEDLKSMLEGLFAVKKQGFSLIKDDVSDIINGNRIVSNNDIERTLDYLLDFCYDDESWKSFHSLCDYYETRDKEAAEDYRGFYRELFDEESIDKGKTLEKKK